MFSTSRHIRLGVRAQAVHGRDRDHPLHRPALPQQVRKATGPPRLSCGTPSQASVSGGDLLLVHAFRRRGQVRGCHLSRWGKQRHLHARVGELLAYHPRSERRQPRHRTPGCGLHRHGTELRQPAEQHIGRVAVCSRPRFPMSFIPVTAESSATAALRITSLASAKTALPSRQGTSAPSDPSRPGKNRGRRSPRRAVQVGIDVKARRVTMKRQRIGGRRPTSTSASVPARHAARRCSRHDPGAAARLGLKEPGRIGKGLQTRTSSRDVSHARDIRCGGQYRATSPRPGRSLISIPSSRAASAVSAAVSSPSSVTSRPAPAHSASLLTLPSNGEFRAMAASSSSAGSRIAGSRSGNPNPALRS